MKNTVIITLFLIGCGSAPQPPITQVQKEANNTQESEYNVTDNSERRFGLEVAQNGEVVEPDEDGNLHLKKAPFDLVFTLNFKVQITTYYPFFLLHLSTNKEYYQMLKDAKTIPWAVKVRRAGFMFGIVESENPPDDSVVLTGNYEMECFIPEEGPDQEYMTVIHALGVDRLHSCHSTETETRCTRKINRLEIIQDDGPRVFIESKDFPSEIHISSKSFVDPTVLFTIYFDK